MDAQTGVITTVAYREYGVHSPLGDNGPAINAGLGAKAIAVESAGNLFVADDANKRIRAIRKPPAPPALAAPPAACAPITANQATNGSLTTTDYLSQNRPASYADCYTFAGNSGDRVSITLNASGFDPYLYLLNSSRQVVTSSLAPINRGARLPERGSFVLPRTRTYTIEAAGYSSASLGGYSLTLTGNPLPAVASIEPSSAVAGSSVSVTVRGTNFTAGSSLSISGAGASVSSIGLVDGSLLTAKFNFSADAAPGPRTVTLTTTAGTSLPVTFTLIPRPPTVTSLLPNTAAAGRSAAVTVVGTGFVAGATAVTVSGTGVSVPSVNFVSAERVDATFVLDPAAAPSARGVTVSTVGGTSGAATFTVLPKGSTITLVSPASAAAGSATTLTLTGAGFVAGATSVAVSGGGITIGSVSVSNATSLTVNLTIALAAATGPRNVTVTTPDGPSNSLTFTVA